MLEALHFRVTTLSHLSEKSWGYASGPSFLCHNFVTPIRKEISRHLQIICLLKITELAQPHPPDLPVSDHSCIWILCTKFLSFRCQITNENSCPATSAPSWTPTSYALSDHMHVCFVCTYLNVKVGYKRGAAWAEHYDGSE